MPLVQSFKITKDNITFNVILKKPVTFGAYVYQKYLLKNKFNFKNITVNRML